MVIPSVGVSAYEAVAIIGTWACQVEGPGTMYPAPRADGGISYAAAAGMFRPSTELQSRVFPDPVPLSCFARSGAVHYRLHQAARIFSDVRQDLLFGRRAPAPPPPIQERVFYGPASLDDPLLRRMRLDLAAMVAGVPRPGFPGYRCPVLTHHASARVANAIRTVANAPHPATGAVPINLGTVMALRAADGEPVHAGDMAYDAEWLGYPGGVASAVVPPYGAELGQCADDIAESLNRLDDVEGCGIRLRVDALEGFARTVGSWFRAWREEVAPPEDADQGSADEAAGSPRDGAAPRGYNGP